MFCGRASEKTPHNKICIKWDDTDSIRKEIKKKSHVLFHMQILTFNVSVYVLEGVKMRVVYELKKEAMAMGKVGAEEKGAVPTK